MFIGAAVCLLRRKDPLMKFEYTGKIGFCIGADFQRPNPQVVAQLQELGSPAIADGLNKFNVMDSGIKPVLQEIKIAGPALTVRMRPGDNLMLHKAIEIACEGDVIVVDTCGCTSNSVMGGLMASIVHRKKLGGVIVDGCIRDIGELQEKKFKIFARGATPSVGDKDGPGEINLPISCGGVPVLPGYIVVGDENGVVVVPPFQAQEIIEGARKKLAYEAKRAEEIAAGLYAKPDIDEKLRAAGIL